MAPVVNMKNFYNNVLNSKSMKKFIPDNPTDIAAKLALISTTTKDAVNCYYYVTQSLNNKKIPEEKRKFVAGLDLSNGILNVVVQFGLGSLINTYSSKIFDKWFGKSFKPESAKNLFQRMKSAGLNYQEDQIVKGMDVSKKWAKAGFKVMAVLLVTQVIAKRVIVPFLSTPMAGVFKEQLEKREQKLAAKKLGEEQGQPKAEENPKKDVKDAAPSDDAIKAEPVKAETADAPLDPFKMLVQKDVKFKA